MKVNELIHAKYTEEGPNGVNIHSQLLLLMFVIIIPAELCLMSQPLPQSPSLFLPTWTVLLQEEGSFKGPRVSSCLSLGNGLPEKIHVLTK